MTDPQFQHVMNECAAEYNKYKALLDRAEKEYERRFGFHPSDADDDFWIDSLRGAGGAVNAPTVQEVTENAQKCSPREP